MDNHAVIVGGTGMLRGATQALAETFARVSLLARFRSTPHHEWSALARVVPHRVDYGDAQDLARCLEECVAANGPADLLVAWVHANGAPRAYGQIVERFVARQPALPIVHVVGSASKDPLGKDADCDDRDLLRAYPRLRIIRALLGFIREPGGSRWLTHREISDGVLRAVSRVTHLDKAGLAEEVIGTVRPWDDRP